MGDIVDRIFKFIRSFFAIVAFFGLLYAGVHGISSYFFDFDFLGWVTSNLIPAIVFTIPPALLCGVAFWELLFEQNEGSGSVSVRDPDAPPCPKCGEKLATKKARQCLSCGADWHSNSTAPLAKEQ